MATYTKFDSGVFVLGDCLEVMKKIPDSSVDMILCDLPYGTTQNKWDEIIPFQQLWQQYARVTKRNAAIVLSAAQPFTAKVVMSNPAMFKQALVWKKNIAPNFLNANRQHLARHEDILLFATGQCTYNQQRTPGRPYTQKRSGKDDTGNNYGKIARRVDTVNDGSRAPISILEFDREVGFHPTQKPVQLFEYLIRTYTNPGEKVLDNCAGSGTTAIAAINSDRRWICIEKLEEYYSKAVNRIENHVPLVEERIEDTEVAA